jgi:hypothetical protein
MSAPFSRQVDVPKISPSQITEIIAALQGCSAFRQLLEQAQAHIRNADFAAAANTIDPVLRQVADESLGHCLNTVFGEPDFRAALRDLAPEHGLNFHGNLPIHVQMPNGRHVPISSPWFEKSARSGRRKVGPKAKGSSRKGAHLGLDVLGFFGKVCPTLGFRAIVFGILCPSLAIASSLLKDEDIILSQNKIRDIFATFDDLDPDTRADLSCTDTDSCAGKRVIIADDGGRIRERVPKAGRVPDKLKRRGFDTPWREPKLFTIYIIDEAGNIDKEIAPWVDGSIGDNDEQLDKALALLRAYLERLNIAQAKEVTLLGDGGAWIWKRIPALLHELKLPAERLTQIIDYYHAKENLSDLIKDISDPFMSHDDLRSELTENLYQGEFNTLKEALTSRANAGKKRTVARRFRDYFQGNAQRMRYAELADTHPIGSGCIESAIRRVINLRIKSPGIFWFEQKAETMIFLRAKLLYRRWSVFVGNWLDRCKAGLKTASPLRA